LFVCLFVVSNTQTLFPKSPSERFSRHGKKDNSSAFLLFLPSFLSFFLPLFCHFFACFALLFLLLLLFAKKRCKSPQQKNKTWQENKAGFTKKKRELREREEKPKRTLKLCDSPRFASIKQEQQQRRRRQRRKRKKKHTTLLFPQKQNKTTHLKHKKKAFVFLLWFEACSARFACGGVGVLFRFPSFVRSFVCLLFFRSFARASDGLSHRCQKSCAKRP